MPEARLPPIAMPFTTLVSTEQLARRLDDPVWIVFDCRHDLQQPEAGRRAYLASHIPGAHFLHLDEDLSGSVTGRNGRHPLPDAGRLAARLAALGVDESKQVVAYDGAGGMMAARLWWLLRWLGHANVALLDGGWGKWLREDQPETAAMPQPSRPSTLLRTGFTAAPRNDWIVDAAYVERHLNHPEMRLIDARSPERFQGIEKNFDPVAGHVPGAVNRFFMDNLEASGCFKDAGALREAFREALAGARPEQTVQMCGSGITACHNLLAMEIAGLPGSRLYPGSWSEWCSDPARPVAR